MSRPQQCPHEKHNYCITVPTTHTHGSCWLHLWYGASLRRAVGTPNTLLFTLMTRPKFGPTSISVVLHPQRSSRAHNVWWGDLYVSSWPLLPEDASRSTPRGQITGSGLNFTSANGQETQGFYCKLAPGAGSQIPLTNWHPPLLCPSDQHHDLPKTLRIPPSQVTSITHLTQTVHPKHLQCHWVWTQPMPLDVKLWVYIYIYLYNYITIHIYI